MKNVNWFLLRGLVRDARHWENFPDVLSPECASVNTIEIPGVGRRHSETSPLSIQKYPQVMREEYLATNVSGPKAILAFSLGGMIAQSWLDQFKDDFDLAVIVNSSAANLSPFYKRFHPSSMKMVARLIATNNQETRERAILNQITK